MLPRILVQADSSKLNIRTPRAHLTGFVAGGGCLMVGATMLILLRPLQPFQVLLGACSLAFGIALLRGAVRGGIVVTRSELVEYGDLRKRTYDARHIEEFFVERAPHVLPWYSLWLRNSDNHTQPLQQVRLLGIRPRLALEILTGAAKTATTWLHST